MAGIYRRGRTFWARAQRQGREYRTSLKTADRRIAERRYRDWFTQLEALAWGDRPRQSFAEAVERFIAEHLVTLKPASARRYGISLKWLADALGSLFLDEITREKLAAFEAWRRTTGGDRPPKSPTIRRDFACLSSLLTSCEDWGWIAEGSNPVPGFLRRRARRGLKEAPPRVRYLSEEEEAKLLKAATPAVAAAIAVAIDTGLRREEQFSLTWPQIDSRRGVITTTRNTKSGRARSVPLPTRTATILSELKLASDLARYRTVMSLYVFRHADGVRLVNMEKGFKAAARRAGLKDLRWHDLRRTAGCRWLQRDRLSMIDVSVLLGHSSIAVTEQRYAFLDGEEVAMRAGDRTKPGTIVRGLTREN